MLDLARFDAAVDRDALLSPAMKQLMWSPATASDGHPFPYALGWFVQQYAGTRFVWHNGNLPDRYSALYLKVPDSKLTLLLLANSDALSMPFKLAAGDVSKSAFAGAVLTMLGPGRVPDPAGDCRTKSADLIDDWRAAHRLRP